MQTYYISITEDTLKEIKRIQSEMSNRLWSPEECEDISCESTRDLAEDTECLLCNIISKVKEIDDLEK